MFDPTQCHDDTLMHADCRIFNTDRNDANILVRRRHVRNEDGAIEGVKLELVPIDLPQLVPVLLEPTTVVCSSMASQTTVATLPQSLIY